MRKGFVLAGVALLALGLVLFFFAALGAAQASADFINCLSGYPTYPAFGFPSACVNAMNALAVYQGIEGVGGVMALVGLVLLVIGLVMQPERPAPMTYYPPPVYGPPPGYAPPQGPQSPPPQP